MALNYVTKNSLRDRAIRLADEAVDDAELTGDRSIMAETKAQAAKVFVMLYQS